MSRFCWGEDLRCCADCRWNIDNIDPERILPDGKPFKPAANPPKCHDWAAVPHKSGGSVSVSVQELTLAPRQLNLPTAILQQAVSAPMESASPQAVSAHIPESYSSPCETGTFFSWQECPLLGRIGGDQLGIRAHGCPRPAQHGADHAVAVDALRVLVVRDKNSWFARGIEIDYSASGATLEDVLRHFERGFALTIQAHLEKFQTLSRFLKWAPTEVIDEYEAGKESFEVRMVTICKTSPIPRSFPYEHLKFSFPPEEAVA